MDITKRPKGPAVDASSLKNNRLPERYTLMNFFTEDGAFTNRISYLKELSNKKGPWSDYYEFFKKNQSGDMETMKPDIRKYCEKMLSDVKSRLVEDLK